MRQKVKKELKTILSITRLVIVVSCIAIVGTGIILFLLHNPPNIFTAEKQELQVEASQPEESDEVQESYWEAPPESDIPAGEEGEMIQYGKELVSHTSVYLGPKGSVAQIANGMNCQNCHNDAGTKDFGLNFSAVASTYPQFRPRANADISIVGRINGCFQRSLNGEALDSTTREMKALVAYMEWLGNEVPQGVKPKSAGLKKLAYLDVPADPIIGKSVYVSQCQVCHGSGGEGLPKLEGNEYVYPPLWGDDSYNDGAGLYRLTNFAGFVKYNMPLGVTVDHPQLSDEESWNVAAFVNSQPRPHKDQTADWEDISKKPVDMPIGPYADGFSEEQHKYGPFGPIEEARKSKL